MNCIKVGNSKDQYVSGCTSLSTLDVDDTIYVCDGRCISYGGTIKKVHKSTSTFMAFECEDHIVYLESDGDEGLYVAVTEREDSNVILTKFHANVKYIDGEGYIAPGRIRNSIKELF